MNFVKFFAASFAFAALTSFAVEPGAPLTGLTGKVAVDKATFVRSAEKAHPPLFYINIFLDEPTPNGEKELKALRVYAKTELQTSDGPLEYGDRISFDLNPNALAGPMSAHPFSEVTNIHITGKGSQQERDFANR